MDITEQLRAHADSEHKLCLLNALSAKSGVVITEEDITTVTSFNERELFIVALVLFARERAARIPDKQPQPVAS